MRLISSYSNRTSELGGNQGNLVGSAEMPRPPSASASRARFNPPSKTYCDRSLLRMFQSAISESPFPARCFNPQTAAIDHKDQEFQSAGIDRLPAPFVFNPPDLGCSGSYSDRVSIHELLVRVQPKSVSIRELKSRYKPVPIVFQSEGHRGGSIFSTAWSPSGVATAFTNMMALFSEPGSPGFLCQPVTQIPCRQSHSFGVGSAEHPLQIP